ncbi:hypothetical protein C8R45DRAFT_549961 [Mycena sanguinolenta]|nr:hypothetical protein C8R45DRAFT_549961 [Mycena sanguinolenta]
MKENGGWETETHRPAERDRAAADRRPSDTRILGFGDVRGSFGMRYSRWADGTLSTSTVLLPAANLPRASCSWFSTGTEKLCVLSRVWACCSVISPRPARLYDVASYKVVANAQPPLPRIPLLLHPSPTRAISFLPSHYRLALALAVFFLFLKLQSLLDARAHTSIASRHSMSSARCVSSPRPCGARTGRCRFSPFCRSTSIAARHKLRLFKETRAPPTTSPSPSPPDGLMVLPHDSPPSGDSRRRFPLRCATYSTATTSFVLGRRPGSTKLQSRSCAS